ncbi:hypothetical protein AYY19_06375 [Photobacterium aquimaris]|uniref:hypothetical protein n=1 Tax=Photobacterium aquimaris TaxID=512643 RepID=UPI0007EF5868|nr:hypothetical protein [Photobacterium aquimaris]OBU14353.1 hypothetical protein AYY19_06375 [Photobacterium aquimaris]OBU19136.1 hypothetical protein AYY20_04020 [Photobacterium aquimaris]
MNINPLLLSLITALSFDTYAYNDSQSYKIAKPSNLVSSSQSTINYIAEHILISVNVRQNFNDKTKQKNNSLI